MPTLVLLRHGQSQWNLENRFTGWTDVDLSPQGRRESEDAGRLLRDGGYDFDVAHTSVLTRAIHTLWLVLDTMDRSWLPVFKSWRLNERHYGALQGLNKVETATKYGEKQVHIWRRSYDVPPPPLTVSDPRFQGHDRRYADIPSAAQPKGESLAMTIARTLPYWHEVMAPQLREGQRLLVCAHGNSLRGLVKYLDNLSDAAVTELNIPTGIPLVYRLDKDLRPQEHFYLGDPQVVAQATAAVAAQGKK